MDVKEKSKVRMGQLSLHIDLDCSIIDLNVHQFSIGDISALGGAYQRGGIAREVKQPITMSFVKIICIFQDKDEH